MVNFFKAALALSLLVVTSVSVAQDACPSNVKHTDAGLAVDSEGPDVDATESIQCALDLAAAKGIRLVELKDGEYKVRAIEVEGFNGVLRGQTRAGTVLNTYEFPGGDEALWSCVDYRGTLNFFGGDASVERLTLKAGNPCVDPVGHFGIVFSPELTACADESSSATHRGSVDNISLENTTTRGSRSLVGIYSASPCADKIAQGSLAIRRSDILGWEVGAQVVKGGNAAVDIYKNTFVAYDAVIIADSWTLSNIALNTFNYVYSGISVVAFDPDGPAENTVLALRNTFEEISDGLIAEGDEGLSVAILGINGTELNDDDAATTKKTNLTLLANGNRIRTATGGGIELVDVNNASLNFNLFRTVYDDVDTPVESPEAYAIWLYSDQQQFADNPSKGNVLSNNLFTGKSTRSLVLGAGTTETLVGPTQGFIVDDLGDGNIILEGNDIIVSE